MRHWLPSPWTALSALLLALSYPPWDQAWLAWFAFFPWLIALGALEKTQSMKRAALEGLWLSIITCALGFNWIVYAIHQYGNLPWSLSILGLVLFTPIGQPQLPIFAALRHWIRKKALTHKTTGAMTECGVIWIGALTYAAFDAYIPKLFGDTMGQAFYRTPIVRLIAEFGGIYLLTFLMMLSAETLFSILRTWQTRSEPSLWPLASRTFASLFSTLALMGALLSHANSRQTWWQATLAAPKDKVLLSMLQANIGDFDKVAAETGRAGAAETILNRYFNLGDHALAQKIRPEILVWPETAYPSTFRSPDTSRELERDRMMEHYARTRQIPLLFGGYDRVGHQEFNSVFLLTPEPILNGKDLAVYHKAVLLPFGEYIPLAEDIDFIRKTFPQMGFFGSGPGPQVLDVPLEQGRSLRVSPIICYEALFPNFVLAGARMGSQAILNVTNDSWFGPWGEPHQHFAISVFRAIEAGIPQIRVTNTGISALILPDGSLEGETAIGQTVAQDILVPLYEHEGSTLVRWGNWFPPFSVLLGAMLTLWICFNSNRGPGRQTGKGRHLPV